MNGILLIDKPARLTSHDVVARIRKQFGLNKLGHAGTLDPFATGLLILCVNAATKIAAYLAERDKEYVGELKLGEVTDTQDGTGRLIAQQPLPADLTSEEHAAARLAEVAARFTGDILQTPPMFSAIKVGGCRLYALARRGKTIEREPRSVRIHELEILATNLPYVRFRVVCSKGTYIRTLAHDLGQAVGCGAHLSTLRRTRIGPFSVHDALPLDALLELSSQAVREQQLISIGQALPFLPAVTLGARAANLLTHGGTVTFDEAAVEYPAEKSDRPVCVRTRTGRPVEEDIFRVHHPDGRCIALARPIPRSSAPEQPRRLRPVKVLVQEKR